MGLFSRRDKGSSPTPAPATPPTANAPGSGPSTTAYAPGQPQGQQSPQAQAQAQAYVPPPLGSLPQQQLLAQHYQQQVQAQQQAQFQAQQQQQYQLLAQQQQQQQQPQQQQQQAQQAPLQQFQGQLQPQFQAQQGGPQTFAVYSAQGPPYNVGGGPAISFSAGGGQGVGDESSAWLYEAVAQAAAAGKPLQLNFTAQMSPVMANDQYGIAMPHQHPYGPPTPTPHELQQQQGGDGYYAGGPYDHVRIPALPDMRHLPPELQDFRDQCATGVRQAVAMITAMEHQLAWERSRRQQAEEDCKVLLAAVHSERGVGEALLGVEERRRAEAAAAMGKLHLAADELPRASEAATTIQKHVRGRAARKEFETHLRDILRGVDPLLDPAAMPAAAQRHISNVNTTGAPRQQHGLRAVLLGAGATDAVPADQVDAAEYYRTQVDRISKRLSGHKDAGVPHPGDNSGDPLHEDVKNLLTGTYPASSAQVIAALVRRCRELQSALLEAVGQLEEAQLSIQGLKEANAKLGELSAVRSDLEAARHDNVRLAGTVAKMRSVLTAQAAGANAAAARENPHVAAWYRRAYADAEWQKAPPRGPGGVGLLDGPDEAVERWDDLRASQPEPVLMPRVDAGGVRYRDLLALKQDMAMSAARGPADPLYPMHVPDRSAFVYERDTPLIPVQSAAPLIRESMPPVAFVGVHDDLYRRTPRPSALGGAPTPQAVGPDGRLLPSSAIGPGPSRTPSATTGGAAAGARHQQASAAAAVAAGAAGGGGGGGVYGQLLDQQAALRQQAEWEAAHGGAASGQQQQQRRGPSFTYNRDTPVVPVYSVLPLIREDEYIRRSSSPGREAPPPPTPPPPGELYYPPAPQLPTNLHFIREQGYPPPPHQQQQQQQQQQPYVPATVVAAAVAATGPHTRPPSVPLTPRSAR